MLEFDVHFHITLDFLIPINFKTVYGNYWAVGELTKYINDQPSVNIGSQTIVLGQTKHRGRCKYWTDFKRSGTLAVFD